MIWERRLAYIPIPPLHLDTVEGDENIYNEDVATQTGRIREIDNCVSDTILFDARVLAMDSALGHVWLIRGSGRPEYWHSGSK